MCGGGIFKFKEKQKMARWRLFPITKSANFG
jgi:hypothetical protein